MVLPNTAVLSSSARDAAQLGRADAHGDMAPSPVHEVRASNGPSKVDAVRQDPLAAIATADPAGAKLRGGKLFG